MEINNRRQWKQRTIEDSGNKEQQKTVETKNNRRQWKQRTTEDSGNKEQ